MTEREMYSHSASGTDEQRTSTSFIEEEQHG